MKSHDQVCNSLESNSSTSNTNNTSNRTLKTFLKSSTNSLRCIIILIKIIYNNNSISSCDWKKKRFLVTVVITSYQLQKSLIQLFNQL